MRRSKPGTIVASLVSLAMIPVVWMFALEAIPSLETVQTETAGGRMGPWVFTWGLVWVATIACAMVAWLCYTTLNDTAA
jgi:hypothetical protein